MKKAGKARTDRAAIQAWRVLAELGVEHPGRADIRVLARTRGAFVRESPIRCAEGWLVKLGRIGLIRVRADIPEPARKRFVIAHELGHFELHPDSNQLDLCLNGDLGDGPKPAGAHELEANAFAAEFLLPERLISPHCRNEFPGFEGIRALAREFRTSIMLTTMRLIDLTPLPAAVVVSEAGTARWYRKSKAFPPRLAAGTPVPRGSLAHSIFLGARPEPLRREVPESVWSEASDYAGGTEPNLIEECFRIASHDTILSLLKPVEENGRSNPRLTLS